MMLWKCCIEYTSKFGKLRSGHRTGKCQFSFPSQRRVMPKNDLLLLSSFSRVLLCDLIDCGPQGSSVPGILQTRTLEWVSISFSNACMHAKSLHSCPTLCDPIDGSPPGFSVHRILWERILDWVAISFSTKNVQITTKFCSYHLLTK